METQTLETGATTALAANELVLTRLFDAPRELVWKAWTTREHLMRWSAPQGFTTTYCEGDVRVGGAWRTCMVTPEGAEKWVGGTYREVVPVERLVFTHLWYENDGYPNPETLVTLSFSESDGKTLLHFHQSGFASVASRDGHQGGWNNCLDLLNDLLGEVQNDNSMNTQQETIEGAKTDFARAKAQLLTALASTPDDKLNWSPSPTARTPLHQAAHAAWAIKSIHEMLNGQTFQFNSTAEADQSFRAWEQQWTSRETVMELLETNSAEYEQFLDSLTPESLDSVIELPFGSGQAPLAIALTFAPNHTKWHTAQIEYIQTIYGDQIWR